MKSEENSVDIQTPPTRIWKKRKKCQRCVKWDSMRRKKKKSLPILFTFHFKTVLFHIHTLIPVLVITFVKLGGGTVAIGFLPYQLDRLVSFPVSNYPTTNQFLPSTETKEKQKKKIKKKTNSSAVTVSLMAYSRVVTTILANCCLFLFFFCFLFFNFRFESTAKMTGERSDCFWSRLTIIQTAKTAERKTWKELKRSYS